MKFTAFYISTSFLKYLFQIDKKIPNNKRLMRILFEMHSKLNLKFYLQIKQSKKKWLTTIIKLV